MNRFGPTTASRDRAVDQVVSSWMAGRHLHIDTIRDLQAHSYGLEQIVRAEPRNLTQESPNE